jgi:hypothetical protein
VGGGRSDPADDAVFPANVSAARRKVAQGDPLVPRTALQLAFLAAAGLALL